MTKRFTPKICDTCRYGDPDKTFDSNQVYCKKYKMEVGRYKTIRCNFYKKKAALYHKFGAKPTYVDCIRFDSKAEANRFRKLLLLKKGGILKYFIRQPIFDIGGGVKARADFLNVYRASSEKIMKILEHLSDSAKDKKCALQQILDYVDTLVQIEDVKGHLTSSFIKNKKLVERKYPIEILIIKEK